MRPHFVDDPDQRELIEEVTGLEVDAVEQVLDPPVIRGAGSADQSVDLIALLEEQLREIRTVLAGNSGNKSALGHSDVRLAGNSGARPARARRTPLAAADGVIIQRGRPGTASLSFLPDFLAALQFLRGFCKSAQARAPSCLPRSLFSGLFLLSSPPFSSGISVAFDEDDSSRSLMLKPRLGVAVLLTVLLSAATANAAAISLTWDRNAESTVTGYVVQVGSTPGGTDQAIDIGNQISWTFGSAVAGKTYYFRVLAYNAAGAQQPAIERGVRRGSGSDQRAALRQFRYADQQRDGIDGIRGGDRLGAGRQRRHEGPDPSWTGGGRGARNHDLHRRRRTRAGCASGHGRRQYPKRLRRTALGGATCCSRCSFPTWGRARSRSMRTQTTATDIRRCSGARRSRAPTTSSVTSVRRNRYAGPGRSRQRSRD